MVNPDPLARPHASRLANLQSLRGTNSSNVKSRSQLYQELKETQRKLRMLEFELSSSRSSQAHHGGSSAGMILIFHKNVLFRYYYLYVVVYHK